MIISAMKTTASRPMKTRLIIFRRLHAQVFLRATRYAVVTIQVSYAGHKCLSLFEQCPMLLSLRYTKRKRRAF